jgi:hypothetical protein
MSYGVIVWPNVHNGGTIGEDDYELLERDIGF